MTPTSIRIPEPLASRVQAALALRRRRTGGNVTLRDAMREGLIAFCEREERAAVKENA